MHVICQKPTLFIHPTEPYNRSGFHVFQGVAAPIPSNPGARCPAPNDALHPSQVPSNQWLGVTVTEEAAQPTGR